MDFGWPQSSALATTQGPIRSPRQPIPSGRQISDQFRFMALELCCIVYYCSTQGCVAVESIIAPPVGPLVEFIIPSHGSHVRLSLLKELRYLYVHV